MIREPDPNESPLSDAEKLIAWRDVCKMTAILAAYAEPGPAKTTTEVARLLSLPINLVSSRTLILRKRGDIAALPRGNREPRRMRATAVGLDRLKTTQIVAEVPIEAVPIVRMAIRSQPALAGVWR